MFQRTLESFGFAAVLAAVFFAGLQVATVQAEETAATTPLVVKIHADWCGTCTKLNPVMTQLEERVGPDARVVVLDVTDKAAVEASRAKADSLGISAFFDAYKGKTGTVGVLTAAGEPVDVFKGELSVDAYVAALAKAAETPAS